MPPLACMLMHAQKQGKLLSTQGGPAGTKKSVQSINGSLPVPHLKVMPVVMPLLTQAREPRLALQVLTSSTPAPGLYVAASVVPMWYLCAWERSHLACCTCNSCNTCRPCTSPHPSCLRLFPTWASMTNYHGAWGNRWLGWGVGVGGDSFLTRAGCFPAGWWWCTAQWSTSWGSWSQSRLQEQKRTIRVSLACVVKNFRVSLTRQLLK